MFDLLYEVCENKQLLKKEEQFNEKLHLGNSLMTIAAFGTGGAPGHMEIVGDPCASSLNSILHIGGSKRGGHNIRK